MCFIAPFYICFLAVVWSVQESYPEITAELQDKKGVHDEKRKSQKPGNGDGKKK